MIKERKYQEVTYKELLNCIRWCQNYLNLRDWEINFFEGKQDKENLRCGSTSISDSDMWHFSAEVWVDLDLCQKDNANPYIVICHEMLHVFVMGKCRIISMEDEHISYGLQDLLYQEFCRQNKIKIALFE